MPSVVSGVAIDDCDVDSGAVVPCRMGPKRGWIKPRLDYTASSALLGPSDAIFGNAICLRHARSRGGGPPFQCFCRGHKLGGIVTIEVDRLVSWTRKILHCGYSFEGCLRHLGVDCKPLSASIIQNYRDGIDREVRIFLIYEVTNILDEVISCYLLTELGGHNPRLSVESGF